MGSAVSTGDAEDLGTRADRRFSRCFKVTRSHCKRTAYFHRLTEKKLNARNRVESRTGAVAVASRWRLAQLSRRRLSPV